MASRRDAKGSPPKAAPQEQEAAPTPCLGAGGLAWLRGGARYAVFAGGGLKGVLYPHALAAFVGQCPTTWRRWSSRLRGTAGTSIGALMAVWTAAGLSPWRMQALSAQLDFTQLLQGAGHPRGLVSGQGLRCAVRTAVVGALGDEGATLGDLHARFRRHCSIMTVRMAGGAPHLVTLSDETTPEARVVDAVVASMTLPGLLLPAAPPRGAPPGEYVDGAVLCNLPSHVYPLQRSVLFQLVERPGTEPTPVDYGRTAVAAAAAAAQTRGTHGTGPPSPPQKGGAPPVTGAPAKAARAQRVHGDPSPPVPAVVSAPAPAAPSPSAPLPAAGGGGGGGGAWASASLAEWAEALGLAGSTVSAAMGAAQSTQEDQRPWQRLRTLHIHSGGQPLGAYDVHLPASTVHARAEAGARGVQEYVWLWEALEAALRWVWALVAAARRGARLHTGKPRTDWKLRCIAAEARAGAAWRGGGEGAPPSSSHPHAQRSNSW